MGRVTTIEERVIICELAKAGRTDREIATQVGWSKWTVRTWRRRGREGRKALASVVGHPATGVSSTYSASMRETLKAWRAAHPGWGPTTLYGELETDERFNGQELPSVRSTAGFLKQEEWEDWRAARLCCTLGVGLNRTWQAQGQRGRRAKSKGCEQSCQ